MDNNTSCNTECPIKSCLCKLVCFALPVFIVLFALGYVIHHIWLMPIYEATAAMWRPMDQMKEMFPWLIGYYAALSILISFLFCKVKKAKMAACAADGSEGECKIGGKHCPIKFGICFGSIIGLLLGVQSGAAWIFQAIPGDLAVKWLIGWVIQGVAAGVVLALICHCKQKRCAK